MSEPISKPKFKVDRMLVVSIFFLLHLVSLSAFDYELLTIPKESELSYTTGKLENQSSKATYLSIDPDGTGKNVHRFACTHDFFVTSLMKEHAGSCGALRLNDHLGKEATAGWYKPKDFLGFKGEWMRLTSVEVDGEMVWSRDDSVRDQRRAHRDSFYFFALSFFSSSLVYWFGKNQ